MPVKLKFSSISENTPAQNNDQEKENVKEKPLEKPPNSTVITKL